MIRYRYSVFKEPSITTVRASRLAAKTDARVESSVQIVPLEMPDHPDRTTPRLGPPGGPYSDFERYKPRIDDRSAGSATCRLAVIAFDRLATSTTRPTAEKPTWRTAYLPNAAGNGVVGSLDGHFKFLARKQAHSSHYAITSDELHPRNAPAFSYK